MKETMFQNFEMKGTWWIPGKKEKAVEGILKYDVDNITLELFGSFHSSGEFFNVILGTTTDGKSATLIDCYESKFEFGTHGRSRSSYVSRFILVGLHFESKECVKFDFIKLSLTNIEQWVSMSPFSLQKIETETEKGTDLVARLLPIQEIKIPSEKLIIETISGFEVDLNFYTHLNYQHNVQLKITSEEPRSMSYFCDIEQDLQNFFTLLIWEPILTKRFIGVVKESDHSEVFVYYSMKRIDTNTNVSFNDMIVTMPRIKDSLSDVLNSWFEKRNILKPVIDLFFGSIYNPDTYLNFHFLAHIQAIETYHRRKFGGKFMSDEDYESYKHIMTNSIPKEIINDFKDSLKSRIRYGNEFSLRKRLREILQNNNFLDFITNNVSGFVQRIVETRNYFTHYDEKSDFVLEGEDLFVANSKLQLLLIILLFSELGFEENMLRYLMEDNKKLKYIIKRTF